MNPLSGSCLKCWLTPLGQHMHTQDMALAACVHYPRLIEAAATHFFLPLSRAPSGAKCWKISAWRSRNCSLFCVRAACRQEDSRAEGGRDAVGGLPAMHGPACWKVSASTPLQPNRLQLRGTGWSHQRLCEPCCCCGSPTCCMPAHVSPRQPRPWRSALRASSQPAASCAAAAASGAASLPLRPPQHPPAGSKQCRISGGWAVAGCSCCSCCPGWGG